MTVRNLINKTVYDLLEFYTSKCLKEGEDAEYLGVKLLEEPEKFVKGAFFNACAHLCAHYSRTGDKRFCSAVKRLHFAVKLIGGDKVNTWGKTTALHGMCTLKRNCLDKLLSPEEIAVIEEKTRYDDFFDKETVTLKGAPTNYYQVAMACAGMRELLGFESDGYCDKIKEKLFSIMSGFSDTGWMDECPPYGRFDRYTTMICAELSDTLYYIDRETPEFAKINLAKASELALACANPKGDGILYGRSLSIHGDCALLEILSTALRLRMIPDEQIPAALAYSRAILEKSFNFWYDKDRHSFDIWFCGRSTNKYRQVRRLLEVNLDMCNHMLTTLANFEAAGLADAELSDKSPANPYKFGNPYKVEFSNENGKARALYCFVQNGRLVQLPLINAGNLSHYAAYLPFPVIAGELEASPEGPLPWLVPEFTLEGEKYVPSGFYTDISDRSQNGKTVVTAKGFMLKRGAKPEQSDIPFTATYTFSSSELKLDFSCEKDFPEYRVIYGRPYGAKCSVTSTTEPEIIDVSEQYDYFTPHGRCDIAKVWTGKGGNVTISIRAAIR